MAVPYTFGTATAAIPLSQLDTNFATAITIGNTAVQLGNTVTTLNNMTLANVTISSGNVTITNVSVTTANVSGTANVQTLVVTANASVAGNVTLSGGTANGVAYLDGSKVLTTGSALTFDGTNLGIGVTSPTARLDVVGASGVGIYQRINNTTAGAEVGLQFADAGTLKWTMYKTAGNALGWFNHAGASTAMTLDASGNLLVGTTGAAYSTSGRGLVEINGSSSALTALKVNGTPTTYWACSSSITEIGTVTNIPLSLFTNNAERARIDSSGNLLVGATSNALTAARLLVQTASDYQLTVNASTSSGAVYSAINFTQAGAGKGAIYQDHANTRLTLQCNGSGGVYLASGATSWTANSDERLKDIIEPITDATNKVSSLRAVIGKYKTDEEGTRRSFLIAQDVQSVLPEAVTSGTLSRSEDTTEYLGVAYTDVIPLLVAAIKEQNQLIQSLTDRISALEQK